MAEYASFSLDARVKSLVADRIQPQSNKFATGVEIKAMGDLKLNDSPGLLTIV